MEGMERPKDYRKYLKTSKNGKYTAWYCIEDGKYVTYASSPWVQIPQKLPAANQIEAEQFIDEFVAE